MKIRRQITGVLCGLLDTVGSRYSDYDGYWSFGLLMLETESVTLSMIGDDTCTDSSRVLAKIRQRAKTKFALMLERAHIPQEVVSSATLTIKKIGVVSAIPVNGSIRQGFQVSLSAEATSDLGKKYHAEKFLSVAPHDPLVELRSVRRETPNQSALPTPV